MSKLLWVAVMETWDVYRKRDKIAGKAIKLEDGSVLTVGDINEQGGVCDDCRGISHNDLITHDLDLNAAIVAAGDPP